MSYATVANMIERFGQTEMVRLSRSEDDRTTATVNAAKVEIAIADAASLINAYLRGRFAVPVETAPTELVRATCILARYDLAQGERKDPSEEMRLARKEVIGWLEGIAAGKIQIDAPAATSIGTTDAGGARISDRGRDFSGDNLRGW